MEASLGMCIFEADMHDTCLEQGRLAGKKRKEEKYERKKKVIETFYTEDCCHNVERAGKAMNN
eukprot:10683467-Ditylum_brightwellii.AAC.1